MKNDYRFFVADDSSEFRNIIIDEIIELGFSESRITECEKESEAIQVLTEKANQEIFFDFLFIDIDFSEGKNTGERKSGFKIIEHAYNICPFSLIATYSAQYNKFDLLAEHNEYLRRGWIVKVFDKSFKRDLPETWFKASFEELLNERAASDYLWDIWYNHLEITRFLKSSKLLLEAVDELRIKQTILFELNDIAGRLKLFNVNKSPTDLRIIAELYHKCLDLFCSHHLSRIDIIEKSKANAAISSTAFKKYFHYDEQELKLGPELDSVLRKIISHTQDDKVAFGIKFNSIRNGLVHKNWTADLSNILFADLVLSLFVLSDKSLINLDRIKQYSEKSGDRGKPDLDKLLEFIHSRIPQ